MVRRLGIGLRLTFNRTVRNSYKIIFGGFERFDHVVDFTVGAHIFNTCKSKSICTFADSIFRKELSQMNCTEL